MRSILSTTVFTLLLTTTTTLAAVSTPKELFDNFLPSCAHSCAYQVAEDATGCGIEDTDCFCSAEGDQTEIQNQVSRDMQSCLLASGCDQDDYGSVSQSDVERYMTDAVDLCNGDVPEDSAVTLSATKAVLAAGVMMLLAAF
ncbi:hypothetical protein BDV12DRAFT_179676 [Aspergillus spectabilis]